MFNAGGVCSRNIRSNRLFQRCSAPLTEVTTGSPACRPAGFQQHFQIARADHADLLAGAGCPAANSKTGFPCSVAPSRRQRMRRQTVEERVAAEVGGAPGEALRASMSRSSRRSWRRPARLAAPPASSTARAPACMRVSPSRPARCSTQVSVRLLMIASSASSLAFCSPALARRLARSCGKPCSMTAGKPCCACSRAPSTP